MGFEKDQASCTGRGFADVDADGFLKNLHDFVTAHADWGIILDRSTLPTQETCSAVNTGTNEFTVTGHDFKGCEKVTIQDTGGGIPGSFSTSGEYYVIVVDANTIKLALNHQDAYQGTERSITSDPGSNFGITRSGPYIVIADDGTDPSDANDLKNMLRIGYDTNEAGYIRVNHVASFDATNDVVVYFYGGERLSTLDAAAFVYDFRANDNGLFYIQSQIAGTWKGVGVDEFSPLSGFLENNATVNGTTQASITQSASSVTVQVTDSAEANLFTKGEFYYIYDFRTDYLCSYSECTGVGVADGLNADEISFANVNQSFNSGAKISPYPLNVYSIKQGIKNDNIDDLRYSGSGAYNFGTIPFVSYDNPGYYQCIHDMADSIYGYFNISYDYTALITQAPDDKGRYACQRPLITEYLRHNSSYDTTDMNRVLGESKNIYLSDDDGMSTMTTARTIGGKAHISVGDSDNFFDASGIIEVLMINEA